MDDNMLGNISNDDAKKVPPRSFQVVVAATREMDIGKDGKLPWELPSYQKFLKELTMSTSDPAKMNVVIMGRIWESIHVEERPLLGCLNVVLTHSKRSNSATTQSVVICNNMNSTLNLLSGSSYCFYVEKVFVIGGGQILRNVLNAPGCEAIHFTDIEANIECDTFISTIDVLLFQPWYSSFSLVENNIRYSFVTYVRVSSQPSKSQIQHDGHETFRDLFNDNIEIQQFSFLPIMIFEKHEEYTYLRFMEYIISHGAMRSDTLSKFSFELRLNLRRSFPLLTTKIRLNLRRSFPLLTTKRVFWQGVVEELLWLISGSTNVKARALEVVAKVLSSNQGDFRVGKKKRVLQSRGLGILDGNVSRDYLNWEEGDLGPIYGFQWIHFGAEYFDMHTDYTGKGVDQLLRVIDMIKRNPYDDGIILAASNPIDPKETGVVPCNMFL